MEAKCLRLTKKNQIWVDKGSWIEKLEIYQRIQGPSFVFLAWSVANPTGRSWEVCLPIPTHPPPNARLKKKNCKKVQIKSATLHHQEWARSSKKGPDPDPMVMDPTDQGSSNHGLSQIRTCGVILKKKSKILLGNRIHYIHYNFLFLSCRRLPPNLVQL